MPNRRKPDSDLVAAQTAAARAAAAETRAEERRRGMDGLVEFLQTRREQNHFGEDFQLTLTPRRRRA